LLVEDFDIIVELSNFVQKGASYEADEAATDDLVMCLVLFSWLANQPYFKELTDEDVRHRLFDSQRNAIEQDMSPFGFIDDGISYTETSAFTDVDGDYWVPTDAPDFFDEERY
jgi:hypothetical protein